MREGLDGEDAADGKRQNFAYRFDPRSDGAVRSNGAGPSRRLLQRQKLDRMVSRWPWWWKVVGYLLTASQALNGTSSITPSMASDLRWQELLTASVLNAPLPHLISRSREPFSGRLLRASDGLFTIRPKLSERQQWILSRLNSGMFGRHKAFGI